MQYQKVEKLTTGGQAEIWLGVRVDTREPVVLKFLLPSPQLADPEAELRRFHREVRNQSVLWHDGIMPILNYNFTDDPPWYAMPRASRSLADDLNLPWGLLEAEVIEVITQVLAAMEYTHGDGVLHRDLKPANILHLNGRWVISDFGLCRELNSDSTTITRSNHVLGTVAYMAPEQFDNGHTCGPQADIFSIGKILYHCLTGLVPFPYTKLDKVPPKYKYIVSRCLAEDPADRYPTVAELQREFLSVSSGLQELTPPGHHAGKLLQDVMAGNLRAPRQLLQLLLQNSSDEVFFHQFVPNVPKPAIAALHNADKDTFNEVVRLYDSFCEGSHPFRYVDSICDFFESVLEVSQTPNIRQMALRRIAITGFEHNRFYSQQVFGRVVGGLTDPQDVLTVARILRENSDLATFMAIGLRPYSLPAAIREVLPAAA